MPIILSGQKFDQDLNNHGSLAVLAPLEGGFETRLLRRMRSKGYKTLIISARGLGDPEVFLFKFEKDHEKSSFHSFCAVSCKIKIYVVGFLA